MSRFVVLFSPLFVAPQRGRSKVRGASVWTGAITPTPHWTTKITNNKKYYFTLLDKKNHNSWLYVLCTSPSVSGSVYTRGPMSHTGILLFKILIQLYIAIRNKLGKPFKGRQCQFKAWIFFSPLVEFLNPTVFRSFEIRFACRHPIKPEQKCLMWPSYKPKWGFCGYIREVLLEKEFMEFSKTEEGGVWPWTSACNVL